MPDYIDDVFGASGMLSQAFPGYVPRPGQILLARAVDEAIKSRGHVLAEAGCGTGKSIAYSVPAIWHAHHSGKSIVIATGGITLQEQLVSKDLPLLRRILPWPFTFALLKGRNNYLCLSQLEKYKADRDDQHANAEERRQLPIVEQWADACAAAGLAKESGDVSDLPFEPLRSVWRRFSVASDECKRSRCRYHSECFAIEASERARHAQVIVTNYHMLYAHLAVYLETQKDLVISQFEVAILDECFPAGTRIGETLIEQLRPGDKVPSYCERTQRLVQRTVRSTFVRKAARLLRVHTERRSVVCTPGHPFLTPRGWTSADALNVGDLLLEESDETDRDRHVVHGLRNARARHGQTDERREAARSSLLLQRARTTMGEGAPAGDRARDGSQTRRDALCSDEARQPDAPMRSARPGIDNAAGDALEAAYTGRQRARVDRAASSAGDRSRLALRGSRPDWEAASSLQARHRGTEPEDRDRSRRGVASCDQGKDSRRAQGRLASWARVDRVEVLEPGRDGTFGGVCPDGLVFNLEVEETNTYVANGFVVHNCHKAADIARDVFGFRISLETVRRLGRKVRALDNELGVELDYAANDFFLLMSGLVRDRDRYKARLTGDYLPVEIESWTQLGEALADAYDRFKVRAEELLAEYNAVHAAGLCLCGHRRSDHDVPELDGNARMDPHACVVCEFASYPCHAFAHDEDGTEETLKKIADELGGFEILRDRALTVHANLKSAMAPKDNRRAVYFLEEDEKRRVSVSSKLVHPSDALTPGLWQKRVGYMTGLGPRVAVIATSATLATGEGEFDYVAEELGCPPGYASLVAPSPFDWPNQCLFICPSGMPEPNDPIFKEAVAGAVGRIIELAHGRTLGLFTSRRVLDHTFGALVGHCRALGITLLKQGDAPRTKLLETFTRDISSVLLGTESFWAGVDVPGESLSVVVIDRLPFPTPDDPILDVLSSQTDNWFREYSIPRATIAFKQGFGRLIRSLECRGVVVCLDNRIVEKRYGKKFLRSIPKGVRKTTDLDAIAEWLGLPVPPPPEAPALVLKSTVALVEAAVATVTRPEIVPQLSLFTRAPVAPPVQPGVGVIEVVLPAGWNKPPHVVALPKDWDELPLPEDWDELPPSHEPAWDEP